MESYAVKYYGDESVRAFVPPPLPPKPPVRLAGLELLLEQANHSLGRLDGLASVLPNLPLFIYAWVRKEALLSSQIEGTQASLSDLLLFESKEIPGVPDRRHPPGQRRICSAATRSRAGVHERPGAVFS